MADKFQNIQVPDGITGECASGGYGFRPERLRQVYEGPDQTHEIRHGDLVLKLYLKGNADLVDVVAVRQDQVPRSVAFAVRAYSDLSDTPLTEMTPLAVLRCVIDRFGLTLRIAGESAKFFLTRTVPISESSPQTQLVSVSNPQNHSFVSACCVRIQPPLIQIALAFCLDTTEYGSYRKSH